MQLCCIQLIFPLQVASKDRDGDIILVALSEQLDSGLRDDAVRLLLQDEYIVIYLPYINFCISESSG